ncbi:MAG: hypothetical protein ACHP9T_15930 [Caulobacterales bacterium]|jgi:hypothetical protein
MLDALCITEDEAAGLSELAALDLAMARDFAARAQAAEDPETANDLARSYQRMARSYRQSLALKVRLQREMALAERDAAPPGPAPRDEGRIAARADELRGAVQRVICAEREAADPSEQDDEDLEGYLLDLLETRLDLGALDNRFGLEPLDDHVMAFCRALGLDPRLAARWRDLPPPDEMLPDPPPWRGSG